MATITSPPHTAEVGDPLSSPASPDSPPIARPRAERRRALVISAAVLLSGAVNLGLEMVASRVLAPFFGNSLTVWGAIIGITLTGLSIGYWIGGIIADKRPTPSLLVAIITLGAFAVLLVPVVDRQVLTWIVEWDPGPTWNPIIASIVLFVPASVVLACVSPVAVRLRAESLTNMGRTAGRLFSVSTFGSIAGVFSTSFWLVPRYGTQQLIAVGAVVLLLTAAMLAASERLLVHGSVAIALAVVFALVATSFDTKAGSTLSRAEAQNWSPQFRKQGLETGPRVENYAGLRVRYQKDTQYHRLAVVDDEATGVRYLRFDASYQSGMKLADPIDTEFRYADYFHLARVYNPKAKRILLIGLGGGSMPKRWLRDFPDMTMDVVEIDPEVVGAAKKYFALPDDPRLEISTADGRIFLKDTPPGEKWDAIFLDAYYSDGLPFHLATSEFFDITRSHLNNNGVLVMNTIGAIRGKDSKLLRAVYKTVQGVYPSVHIHPVAEGATDFAEEVINNMIVATTDAALGEDELLDRLETLKEDFPKIPDLAGPITDRWDLPVQINDVPELTDDFAPTDALLRDASPS